MCHKIESDFILIHHLKNKNSCSIIDLVLKKNLIEEKIPSVFIDVSKKSVLSSVFNYPEIFSWQNNEIIRCENSKEFFQKPLINYFDIDLNEDIKNEITAILEID